MDKLQTQAAAPASPIKKHEPHKRQPLDAAHHPDAHLTAETVASLAGAGRSTIYAMVAAGRFPKPIKRGARCTRWRAGDVTAWLKAQAGQC